MRNISLSSSERVLVPGAHITATAVDLDRNVLYAVSEKQNLDADVEIEVWRVGTNTQVRIFISMVISGVLTRYLLL